MYILCCFHCRNHEVGVLAVTINLAVYWPHSSHLVSVHHEKVKCNNCRPKHPQVKAVCSNEGICPCPRGYNAKYGSKNTTFKNFLQKYCLKANFN